MTASQKDNDLQDEEPLGRKDLKKKSAGAHKLPENARSCAVIDRLRIGHDCNAMHGCEYVRMEGVAEYDAETYVNLMYVREVVRKTVKSNYDGEKRPEHRCESGLNMLKTG